MRNLTLGVLAAALALSGSVVQAQDKPLLGIVSISATEANNVRYIQGATKAAEELGWQVNVVDAAGNADQANAAIQNFAQLGAHAIVDMVFPFSSIGAGLDAAGAAGIPVVTWGGGLGATVAATNGSGGPMAIPVVELMVEKMGGKGSILALTYRTGEVCRNREVVMDEIVAKYPEITVTKNEVRIPGYFEDGAQYANAWLASHPAGAENLAIWGCWDDPSIGAIGSLRAQGRDDVLVYGINGNAQALENIKNGFMTATAWQDSFTEGYNMVKMLEEIKAAGASWEPKAAEVPAVLVTKETVDAFLAEHPDAIQ
jgi:ribose transport system substrate-binding protein